MKAQRDLILSISFGSKKTDHNFIQFYCKLPKINTKTYLICIKISLMSQGWGKGNQQGWGQQPSNQGWGQQPQQQGWGQQGGQQGWGGQGANQGWGGQGGQQGWAQNKGNQGWGQQGANQGWSGNQGGQQGWGNQGAQQGWSGNQGGQQGWGQNKGFGGQHGFSLNTATNGLFNTHQDYVIATALSTDKVVDISLGENATRNQVFIYPLNGGKNQRFRFQPVGNGNYQIISGIGAALTVPNNSNANGTQLVGAPISNSPNQIFSIFPAQNVQGGFNIKTFNGKVLDVCEGKTAKGTPIIQWDYNGGKNQTWIIKTA